MLHWQDVLNAARHGNPTPPRRDERDEAEWRTQLPADVFRITRRSATEPPFSSELCSLLTPGRYACACCGEVLFDATQKFDSGTGWPSFTQPLAPNLIAYHEDTSHGMSRVETTCNICDAHLGHVFPDGPPPSGLRYCMNALALEKV
jgi:peptide-methionine (R)-S-oxide reductase